MKKQKLVMLFACLLISSSFAQGKAKKSNGSSSKKVTVRLGSKLFKDLKEIYGLKSKAELESLVNKLLKEQLDTEEEK